MIHDIVTGSSGAYTHDEVFVMEADFCYSLLLRKYEYDCYQERAQNVRQDLNRKK